MLYDEDRKWQDVKANRIGGAVLVRPDGYIAWRSDLHDQEHEDVARQKISHACLKFS